MLMLAFSSKYSMAVDFEHLLFMKCTCSWILTGWLVFTTNTGPWDFKLRWCHAYKITSLEYGEVIHIFNKKITTQTITINIFVWGFLFNSFTDNSLEFYFVLLLNSWMLISYGWLHFPARVVIPAGEITNHWPKLSTPLAG